MGAAGVARKKVAETASNPSKTLSETTSAAYEKAYYAKAKAPEVLEGAVNPEVLPSLSTNPSGIAKTRIPSAPESVALGPGAVIPTKVSAALSDRACDPMRSHLIHLQIR